MRYYFSVIDDGNRVLVDNDGIEFPDTLTAFAEIFGAVREVLKEHEWQDRLSDSRQLEIVDEAGRKVLIIPLAPGMSSAVGGED